MTDKWTRTLDLLRAGTSGLLGGTLPDELRYPEKMEIRHRDRTVSPGDLARIYRQQTVPGDIVIFVHGLMYDDTCWTSPRFSMTAALEKDFPVFPVHVRYDSGRHISENGRDLSELLEACFRAIDPFPGRFHIIAHSMGGLVTRSALHQAVQAGLTFTASVDRVILLAVPNRGAPLEKGVQALQLLLEAAPHPLRITARGLRILFENLRLGQEAPLAPIGDLTDFYVHTLPVFYIKLASRILPLRSDGILDLRHGYMLREEWEKEQTWGGLKPNKLPVQSPPGARFYAIAGALSRNPPSAPSPRVMDGMVSTASVANAGENDDLRLLENGRYRLLPGTNHFTMPMNPEIYRVLAAWFSGEEDTDPPPALAVSQPPVFAA
jgi:pimeloyl-ACP methyl ester carboxylesterase